MKFTSNNGVSVILHGYRPFYIKELISVEFEKNTIDYTVKGNDGFIEKEEIFDKEGNPIFKTLTFEFEKQNLEFIRYLENAIKNYSFTELRSKVEVIGNKIKLTYHSPELRFSI